MLEACFFCCSMYINSCCLCCLLYVGFCLSIFVPVVFVLWEGEKAGGGGRGITRFMHRRSLKTIDLGIPTIPERSTSGGLLLFVRAFLLCWSEARRAGG